MDTSKLVLKLIKIITFCESGMLTRKAEAWARSALKNVRNIQITMDDMAFHGKVVPTQSQEIALRKIGSAADKWLKWMN